MTVIELMVKVGDTIVLSHEVAGSVSVLFLGRKQALELAGLAKPAINAVAAPAPVASRFAGTA